MIDFAWSSSVVSFMLPGVYTRRTPDNYTPYIYRSAIRLYISPSSIPPIDTMEHYSLFTSLLVNILEYIAKI